MIGSRKVLGFITAAVAVVALAACNDEDATPVVPEEMAEMDADNVFFGMRQNLTADGVRQARVVADTAFGWRDSTAVHLRNPEMTAYHVPDGRERAVVTGEWGRHDQRTDRLHVTGNVVLVVPDAGRRLESEELYYDPQGNRIWSDRPFALYLEDRPDAITGSWFESDLDFSEITAGGEETEVQELEEVDPVQPPGGQGTGPPPGGSPSADPAPEPERP